jgi:hypothetical protein
MGGNFFLYPVFFHYVPGFESFRNPARMGIFIAFAASLLSAFVLHQIGEENPSRGRSTFRRVLLSVTGVAGAALILLLTGMFDGILGAPADMQARSHMHREIGLSLVLLGAGAGVLWLMVTRKGSLTWFGLLACAVLFIDAYIFSADHNTSSDNPADHFRKAERITSYIKQQEGYFRVNIRNPYGLMMDRNQGMVNHIFTMEGYTPLVLQRIHPPTDNPETMFDLLNVRYITAIDSINHRLMMQERPRVLARAHMVYNVRRMHSEAELLAALKDTAFDPAATALVEGEFPHQFGPSGGATPAWKADITAFRNNRIDLAVSTEREGLLVLSEAFYPGWNAYIDGAGTEVYRTDFNLRGIVVPAGSHAIEFRFESASFHHGLWISLGTILLCVVGWIITWRRSRSISTQGIAQ